jgi:hypothetical protein
MGNHTPPNTEPEDHAPPRRSACERTPTVGGAALRGLPHVSRTEKMMQEVHKSAECIQWQKDAHAVEDAQSALINTGPWLLVAPDNDAEFCMLSEANDPLMYKEAKSVYNSELWEAGIMEEHDSLMAHDVWMLVPQYTVPPGHRIVKVKLVFHCKCNEKGNITRRKVRTIAKGFTQIPSIDYKENYAPVSRMESVCTVLHIGGVNDWEINQMDVKTAFLHGGWRRNYTWNSLREW